MNPEMLKSALRSVIVGSCCLVAGWFAAHGWISEKTITAMMKSEVFEFIVGALVTSAWGVVAKRQGSLIATVDALPDVAGVITKPTLAGRELAKDVPSATVVPAGTEAAAAIVRQ